MDSDVYPILAATVPPQIAEPVLSPELADTTVTVNWDAPTDQMALYGAYVTQYRVYIR